MPIRNLYGQLSNSMFETYQICPYTGLRSFTEEESLYFKGREDDIDQATSTTSEE